MAYIIKLNNHTYLAPWFGFPGMTTQKGWAKVYDNPEEARIHLDKLKNDGFHAAKIQEIEVFKSECGAEFNADDE